MGTKYSTTTSSGYNASPPSDDGSAVPSNEVKWATIKTKLSDVLKTFIEAVDTKLVTFVDEGVDDKSTNYTTDADDHKKTINVTAAATISLGDAATVGASYIVTIHNSHTADITVDRATGANTIDGIAADVNLPPGQSVTFVTNSTPNGYFSDINAIRGFGFGSAYSETAVSVAATGTVDLNLRNGTYFYTGDMSANTVTFTFSNPVVTGRVSSFTLEMTDPGDATSITWPSGVDWPNGLEPTWDTGVTVVSFVTRDGGTTWLGFLAGQAFA